jgi:hypothetical protein
MVVGTCKYCLESNKPLVESHLVPAAVYNLCGVNGEVVRVTSELVSYTGRHVKYPLLCEKCDGSLSLNGENWTLPLLATKEGAFPLYELLQRVEPDCVGEGAAAFAVSRNPDIDVRKLTHFALGVFWKAAVHSWRGREVENLIGLGPYGEQIRKFLRSEGPFPEHVALTVGVLPPPVRHISFCMPYRGSLSQCHHFMFYVPGIAFALTVGGRLRQAKENCFFSHPLHPIIVAELAGDIQAVMKSVARTARISKRITDEVRARGNPT